jgi:phosphatidylserine/phosphatidylglycerophosphate/cardiolipin synthase-like enzyme
MAQDLVRILVEDMSPEFLGRFVSLLNEHEGLSAVTPAQVLREIPNEAARGRFCDFLAEVAKIDSGTQPRTLAFGISCALLSAQHEAAQQHSEVVWTGPLATKVSLRKSAAVLLELINSATKEMIVISFASFKIPDALEAFSRAAGRGVSMHFILESEKESGGRLRQYGSGPFDSLIEHPQVKMYGWPMKNRPPNALLHAKAVIVDCHAALVTSANLSENAISANIEIGILTSGGDVPRLIHDHIMALIQSGEFTQIDH